MQQILGEQREHCKRFAQNTASLTFSSFARLCNATTNKEPMHHYAATILATFSVFIAVWAVNEFIEYRQRKAAKRQAHTLQALPSRQHQSRTRFAHLKNQSKPKTP